MAGKFLDQRDVRAIVPKVRTVGMPENVRRQRLVDSCLPFDGPKVFREIIAIPTARNAGGYEDCWIIVCAKTHEALDPVHGCLWEVHDARLTTFSDDHHFGLTRFKWATI